jgi:hypothetical protein
MADNTPVSETIYASRDAIREQVIELLKQYMELNEVDLTQSSFLSYIIDIFTTLASNLMFYQSNIYKEFFLTQAQLPESIHNLSSFLGYSPAEANFAIGSVLMTIPLPFNDSNTKFQIPAGFEFKTADGIIFISYYDMDIIVTDNTSVSISASASGKIIDVPYNIDTTSENMNFQFIIPLKQYKTIYQEFVIDEDLQPYQFTDIDVPVEGKVSSLKVYVRGPNEATTSEGLLYTRFDSLYLMSNSDRGYVMRVSSAGRKLYFGNGIIGIQPAAGSTVIVHVNETEGSDGNVITGSITTGDRIYSQQNEETQIISYTVTNPAPAYNGKDEEDLQEIRSNSIKSLTSLNRLVSEQDYKNFDVVVPDAPIKSNSIPVLKRSDLKMNEIQIYTILEFGSDIVPSINGTITLGEGEQFPYGTTYLAREYVKKIDDVDYITLFDMTIDPMNEAAYYHYIMREINLVPTLIESWTYDNQSIFNFNVNNLLVSIDSTSEVAFELSYYSTEANYDECICTMTILSTDDSYEMTNVPGVGGGKFVYIFDSYLHLPKNSQTYTFLISNPAEVSGLAVTQTNSQYSADFIVRKDLKSYMLSNTSDDGTSTIIYDIPMIKKSYYDDIDKVVFEVQVLQAFVSSFDLKNYRMLTDFNNIKLSNSTGKSKNMLLNNTTKNSVIDIGMSAIPTTSEIGDRYIVSGTEGGDWTGHRDKIAMCIDSTANIYTFIEPKENDIVYVTNKYTKYVYGELGWREPIFDIPLKISLEVFKENDSSIDEGTLITNIKTSIMDYYSDTFGVSIDIRRSKIIDLVHNVDGVSHCRVLKPETAVFFDFDIDDFTQTQLLEYSPEWMHFTKSDITIKIFTLDS